MGCSHGRMAAEWQAVPREQAGERPLTPRATAPPPPPLIAIDTTTMDADSSPFSSGTASSGAIFAGLGSSSASKAADSAHEAIANAMRSLEIATGHSPKPSLAIVACNIVKCADDAENVRCELVRAMPDSLLHGATSVATLFSSPRQSAGNCGGGRPAPADKVACLVLDAPDGAFAAAWDDTGDALYAAKWLQEQMPEPQGIIMSSVSGQEDRAVNDVQSVFPGIHVYGRSAVKATHWVTMSHLGSSEQGVSLVGIGAHVGFGASETLANKTDFSTSVAEVYDAAMLAGSLKKATGGIITYKGAATEFSFAEHLRDKIGDLPLLGVACCSRSLSPKQDASIGIMLFGERQQHQESRIRELSKVPFNAEEESTSGSTAWPDSPNTDISVAETDCCPE